MTSGRSTVSASAHGVLRYVMFAVAMLTIALGAGLYFILEEKTVGIAVAAFGVFDLLTLPFVLGMIARQQRGGPSDPSYNPYARED
jgi:hypothetical protein